MARKKLIIFDYSGTLSLAASQFAAPDSLMRHLEETGLAGLGVNTPHIFWEKIVNPTWQEGSTTSAGYKAILKERITSFLYQEMSIISCVGISDAASSFVDRYLDHSRMDNRWAALLRTLAGRPETVVIIATDHYAEATGAILRYLHEWGIEAVAANEAFRNPRRASFIVANSADLGFHKEDLRFWRILKSGLRLGEVRRILLFDDFGAHEQREDSYGKRHRVEGRKDKTVKMLETEFRADVLAFPFMIEDGALSKEDAYGNLIADASPTMERFLASCG